MTFNIRNRSDDLAETLQAPRDVAKQFQSLKRDNQTEQIVQKFANFHRLPKEIRHKIMDFLLPEPRVIRARIAYEAPFEYFYFDYPHHQFQRDFEKQASRIIRIGPEFRDYFLFRYRWILSQKCQTTFPVYSRDISLDNLIGVSRDSLVLCNERLNALRVHGPSPFQFPTSLRSLAVQIPGVERQSLRQTMDFLERHAPHINQFTYVVGCHISVLGEPKLLALDEWMEDAITIELPGIGRGHETLGTVEKSLYAAKKLKRWYSKEVEIRENHGSVVYWHRVRFSVSVMAELCHYVDALPPNYVPHRFPSKLVYFVPPFQLWFPHNGDSRFRGIYDGIEEMFNE